MHLQSNSRNTACRAVTTEETTLRQQSINYGNISKQRGGQAKAATPPALPPVYKFNIRVAHAGYTGADSMASTYTIWTEGWTCAIKHDTSSDYQLLQEDHTT